MPRYFFHVDNGTTRLNSEGAELANLETAEQEVVLTCSEILREVSLTDLRGLPWCLWVIDQPNEARKRLLTLTVTLLEDVMH